MNKRILIVVPIMALLICVSCLSSGAISSANPNNQPGEQDSVLGSLQLNLSETPSPSVTPSPSMTPYYTPTVWQFDPWFRVYESGYYDPEMNAVMMDINSEYGTIAEINNSVARTSPSICNPPEEINGNVVVYIGESTNSFWGGDPIPSGQELYGAAVMKFETCQYEMVWVAPAPYGGESGNDFISLVYDPIVDEDYIYQISNISGENIIENAITSDTVFLSCGNTPWEPNNEDVILVYKQYVPGYAHRNAKWIAQIDCADKFDNGNSGRIVFSHDSQDYVVDDFEQWVYLKQVATNVANLPLDSEIYNEFVEIYESLPSSEREHIGNDTTENAYHLYSMMATLDAEYKNIQVESFADYIKNIAGIKESYGNCYFRSNCYLYKTMDWQLLTTTATSYQSETPSP